MVVVKLRHAMEVHRLRTGERMTYDKLSELTGISVGTLQSIGSRPNYHPTLAKIDKLCLALNVEVQDLLEVRPDLPKPKRSRKKAKKKRK